MEMFSSFTFGLYSAFLALRAMVFKSSLQPRFTVDTMFLTVGRVEKAQIKWVKSGNIGYKQKTIQDEVEMIRYRNLYLHKAQFFLYRNNYL